MIENMLWNLFLVTGDVDLYLNYKQVLETFREDQLKMGEDDIVVLR